MPQAAIDGVWCVSPTIAIMNTLGICRTLLLAVLGVALLVQCGCSPYHGMTSTSHHETYALVYLTNGPKSGQGTKEDRQAMFAGHMGNIKRLADEGVLVVAGPFSKPTDPTWRGILVLAVDSTDKALALAATDPGVRAGEFTPVVRLMRASPVLHRTMEFERELEKQQKDAAPRDPSLPPANIRAYVMVTTADQASTLNAIDRLGWRDRIVWSGQFMPGLAKTAINPDANQAAQAVFVLDATDPAEVKTSLTDAGDIAVDSWWSTTSLLKLRAASTK